LWEKDGHKPDSIRVGKVHIPFTHLGPYGIALKAMAHIQTMLSNVDDEMDDDAEHTVDDIAWGATFAIADTLLSEHWLENISDFFNTVDDSIKRDDPRPITRFMAKTAAGFIPGGIRQQITKRIDPGVKDITAPIESFIARVPWLSRNITDKIDLWGDPMTYNHFLDPSLASRITGGDPVSEEMRSVGVKLPETRRMIEGTKLTPQEFQQYMIYSGKGVFGLPPLREELKNRMESDYYSKFATDFGKADYLKDAINMYRKLASTAMIQDTNFDLAQRIQLDQEKRLAKMRMTQ